MFVAGDRIKTEAKFNSRTFLFYIDNLAEYESLSCSIHYFCSACLRELQNPKGVQFRANESGNSDLHDVYRENLCLINKKPLALSFETTIYEIATATGYQVVMGFTLHRDKPVSLSDVNKLAQLCELIINHVAKTKSKNWPHISIAKIDRSTEYVHREIQSYIPEVNK